MFLMVLLADVYPDSVHVRDLGMASATDDQLWTFAIEHNWAIVSKDSDFLQRGLVYGPPPKAIWIRCGNCSTSTIAGLMRRYQAEVRAFLSDEKAACLVLGTRRVR